jgi:hypothetical protein
VRSAGRRWAPFGAPRPPTRSLRATVWSGTYTVKMFQTPGVWSRAYAVDSAGNAVGFVSDSSAPTTGSAPARP